jgi:outer membrane protein assembly factor BamB
MLFTLGISGILSAFDAQSGTLKWQKKFDGKFPEASPPFGASMSPLVAGNLLIAHVGGHQGGALTAFEIQTGNEKWSLVGEGPSYSSPIIVEINGVKQIVAQAHRKIISVDLINGKLLWSIPFVTPCDQNIVTPLVAGDLLIFSSLDTGTFAVRVQKNHEGWSTDKIWDIDEVSMYMSSPLYMDGKIIGMSHRKQGEFFAIDAKSGSIVWTSPPKMAENAAFLANEKSILVLKDDGEIQILDGHAQKFESIKTYKVSNSSTWAHPVPVAAGLLIKNDDSLILLEYASDQS